MNWKRILVIIGSAFFICFFFLTCNLSYSQDTTKKDRLILGNLKVNSKTLGISEMKVDAAFNIIDKLLEQYEYVSIFDRDSVALKLKNNHEVPSILNISKALNCNKIIFTNISRLHNIIRAEIILKSIDSIPYEAKGIGYSAIRYIKENYDSSRSEQAILDPAILASLQRAFAVAEQDSLLFDKQSGKLRVFPAKTIAIAGLEYKNDLDIKPVWDIFKSNVVTSYDAVETIFSAAIQDTSSVIYDIQTRDSLFAIYNLYMIENYNAPTSIEIKAFQNLNIDYFITGKLSRVKEGALVDLFLINIKNNNVKIINSVSAIFNNDDIDKFRVVLKDLTWKLLNLY